MSKCFFQFVHKATQFRIARSHLKKNSTVGESLSKVREISCDQRITQSSCSKREGEGKGGRAAVKTKPKRIQKFPHMVRPFIAARWRGVISSSFFAPTSAPNSSNSSTQRWKPFLHASCRGVWLYLSVESTRAAREREREEIVGETDGEEERKRI